MNIVEILFQILCTISVYCTYPTKPTRILANINYIGKNCKNHPKETILLK